MSVILKGKRSKLSEHLSTIDLLYMLLFEPFIFILKLSGLNKINNDVMSVVSQLKYERDLFTITISVVIILIYLIFIITVIMALFVEMEIPVY